MYEQLNRISKNNATVFFGSTLFSEIPFCELAKSYGLDEYIYNRSVRNLSIYDAQKYLKDCVFDLNPGKIFIEIGEEDISGNNPDIDEFILKYEWLLYTIHSENPSKIHIVSTVGLNSGTVNDRLKRLSLESGCDYIDISDIYGSMDFISEFMKRLKYYIRSGKIDFYDAMNV